MWEYPDHFRCQHSQDRRRSLSEATLRSNSSQTGMNEFILSMLLTVDVTTSSLEILVITFEMMCCDLKFELNINFFFPKFFFFFFVVLYYGNRNGTGTVGMFYIFHIFIVLVYLQWTRWSTELWKQIKFRLVPDMVLCSWKTRKEGNLGELDLLLTSYQTQQSGPYNYRGNILELTLLSGVQMNWSWHPGSRRAYPAPVARWGKDVLPWPCF